MLPTCINPLGEANKKWPPMMWLNTDRFLYLGVIGQPAERCFGALALYLSLQGAHRIRIGDKGSDWQSAKFSIVQPWCKHWLAFDERSIGCLLLLEPETLKFSALPAPLQQPSGAVQAGELAQKMHAALELLRTVGACRYASNDEFDRAFFGEPLAARRLDVRVQKVLERLKASPNITLSAEECAEQACLSTSRFLHLFKAEVGAPFRSYRAWHRARSLLYHLKEQTSLTDFALNYGYPDATHFSHSIRRFAGFTPKAIHSGSRKVALFVAGDTASCRA
ncbi:hypothetical protein AXE65_05980 [Ventosimonas gracilis]|uniref:HTH araC/xylS-type domain-containing protein n=2 Tax=Ventosimonas gracilis TaxID=1680762 RepID=A0A139SML7_9GAMM|nr:hypothetical protein AXE65_05980 [Ventosimonas gracilis]